VSQTIKTKDTNTSIRINEELWREARKFAIDEGIPVSDLVERALMAEMHKRRKEQRGGDV
jgi:post-segregation antitoxin (ccd killing protein)